MKKVLDKRKNPDIMLRSGRIASKNSPFNGAEAMKRSPTLLAYAPETPLFRQLGFLALSLLIDIRSRGRSHAPKQSKDACRQSADLRLNRKWRIAGDAAPANLN